MRYAMMLAVLFLVTACGSDGSIKRPSELSAQERCDNAALALALVEANMPEGSATVERARVNYGLICAEPLPRPAE